jgi:hypothetical protein
MANKGSQGRLGATDSGARPGRFPLGSAQSRAEARALLEARDSEEVRYQTVSILDGKPVNLDGLAETIRAARLRHGPGSSSATEGGPDRIEGGRPDSLEERIRKAKERVSKWKDQESTL